MPIKKENRHRYADPKEWIAIRAYVMDRADNNCEFCGVKNYSIRMNSSIVLAVAHLDQRPENNAYDNLAALCQKCHLAHDEPFRMYHAFVTRFNRKHSHTYDLFEFYYKDI
jgi:5-methylcytosine-specific restriction endonuclease McrA